VLPRALACSRQHDPSALITQLSFAGTRDVAEDRNAVQRRKEASLLAIPSLIREGLDIIKAEL